MKRIFYLSLIVLINITILTGCWNYREVERLAIIAGVAVDKGENDCFFVTVEIIKIGGGKDIQPTSTMITSEGKTIFDAVRNAISLSGKKLYWSHTKVIIVSKEIAKKDILRVIDWFNRDSETRSDVNIFISKEKTAKEILEGKGVTTSIRSFEIAESIKNQKSLSKAPATTIWSFINELEYVGIENVVPTIKLVKSQDIITPQVMGLAIFKKEKMVGSLSGRETKSVLFVKDEVKGGLLLEGVQMKSKSTPVSLEIFESKTKMEPIIKKNQPLEFKVKINVTVALDEISGSENLTNASEIKKLKKRIEKTVTNHVERCIKKVQKKYDADIFGFGAKFYEQYPRMWNKSPGWWDRQFKDLKVNVSTNVTIKGSGLYSKPLKVGD